MFKELELLISLSVSVPLYDPKQGADLESIWVFSVSHAMLVTYHLPGL